MVGRLVPALVCGTTSLILTPPSLLPLLPQLEISDLTCCHWGQPIGRSPLDLEHHQGWPIGQLPLAEPLTQMTISSLFGMVPTRLELSTGLLSLVGHLGVVSWSIGKAGGRSHDGLRGHRVKDVPVTYI